MTVHDGPADGIRSRYRLLFYWPRSRTVDAALLMESLFKLTDLETLEKKAVERAMQAADGNKVRAAKQLGISRMQLYTRLRKFGFENI